ncbi:type II toxin-antitoxin system Rv0910 family toxin [[Mycobacterium] crassicus]|uniref:SRPBCC family protein n=1 Tax=[Mycobacterium] crassicus TaxID=2872309 RepID=A0ABU5XJY1_9MYCO|nr:SRPBCC family protein [Mycolicibacter sp. MYC098]MEB3022278.1 SRPBCC family protein [Mycolicibacter sp. MYC098]
MGHIEATKTLAVSPNALWDTISDLSSWDKWFTIHEKWLTEPPAALAPGSTLTAKIVMLGMANKIEWTVEKVDAPTSLTLSGTGMAGVKCRFDFTVTPDGDGSQFSVAGDFEGALIKGALGKAVEKDGAKQLDKTLAQLEALASAAA